MPDALDAFLAEHAALPWSWGSVDCCLVLADWAMANSHPDPAAAWRGTYADENACRQIVIRRGGVLPLVSDACARAGLPKIAEPARGAIGVVGVALNPDRQFGALFDGDRWLVRGADGFGSLVAPVLGMWSV